MARNVKTVDKDKKKLEFHEALHAELDADKKDGMHYGYAAGDDVIKYPEKITTGSLLFDIVLEGGYRCGWSRFSGPPQYGKTSQGLVWAGQWQKKFLDDAFVVAFNAEGRITADLCRKSGIDTDPRKFLRLDSNVGDFVVNKMLKWVTNNPSGRRFFFLTDSSDALVRAHDLDKTAEQAEKLGGGATLLSFAGKRLSLPISVMGHHLYITSQLRDKVNAMTGGQQESGGNPPKFYSSLSGRMKRYYVKGSDDGNIYDGDNTIGVKTLVELYKTPKGKKDEVLLHISDDRIGGYWLEYELFYLMSVWNFIQKNGSWLAPTEQFADEIMKEKVLDEPFAVQGELKLVRFIENNPKFKEYLDHKFRSTLIPQ